MRCCVSRALTPLLAISALLAAGCGGDRGRPTPPELVPHSGSTTAAARDEVLAAAERAITLDARRRSGRGELKDRTRRTRCTPRKGDDARADAVVYDCLAITFEIKGTINAPPLASGYPFQVRVEYPEHRFTWCKVIPPGGEGAGRPGREVAPDDACGGIGRQ